MHTLAGFYLTNVPNNSLMAQLPAVIDQSLPQDGAGRFLLPSDYRVLASYLLGVDIIAGQFNTPSLRSTFLPQIYPFTIGATVPSTDTPTVYHDRGPMVKMNEGLEVDVSTLAGGPGDAFAGVWLAPRVVAAPSGPVFTAVATSTITTVVGAWTLGALTLSQNLPVGKYAVVGMAALSANGVLVRLVFTGQNNFRPGVLAIAAAGDKPIDDYFRMGQMGLFGEFTNTTIPQLEVLGAAAGADTITVYLDLVKVG